MIITKHQLTVESNCPTDDTRDVYSVTVETHQTIPIEDILAAIEALTREAVYQEELTRRLSRSLQARVITEGEHSGVKTTCEASW